MRIVIDMQGAQAASRKRGIGRYSSNLARSIAKISESHDIHLLLNANFNESVDEIRLEFENLLPADHIHLFYPLSPCSSLNTGNTWRRQTSELIRNAVIQNLNPDMVLILSFFEGLVDDVILTLKQESAIPIAVVLYDLIPYLYPDFYLREKPHRDWYHAKIQALNHANLFLGISASTCKEVINTLKIDPHNVVNISSGINDYFKPIKIADSEKYTLLSKYAINKPFVMYTGADDPRKNIDHLIQAYADLEKNLRDTHQLVIIFDVHAPDRKRLLELAKTLGLAEKALILTGFVPDHELLWFYNLCELFIFPSWHEGFGLPVLEAMACGAPTLASNCSSLPEVHGLAEGLFDPRDTAAITAILKRGLEDEHFRHRLKEHGLEQVKHFSWEKTATRTLDALQAYLDQQQADRKKNSTQKSQKKPRLAYLSPLPPSQSGIADYSAELLPYLAEYYEIELICNETSISDPWINANGTLRSLAWFSANADSYDRILYHFGNSAFHQEYFDLLSVYPGTVVLHDFFLSAFLAHQELHLKHEDHFSKALLVSHGIAALNDRYTNKNLKELIWKYPVNLEVLRNSLGIIIHSEHSLDLAKKWYPRLQQSWALVPLARHAAPPLDRASARKSLGIKNDAFVVCSFGMLDATKMNQHALDAWLASNLANDSNCQLIFVGQNHGGSYGKNLVESIKKSKTKNTISITGWVDRNTYQLYLAAADMAIQLRTHSRGESSAAVLDCMNWSLPTIVNAHGSMAYLNKEAVWLLPDNFTQNELTHAIEALYHNPALREQLGIHAQETIRQYHDPATCAHQYYVAIENFYQETSTHVIAQTAKLISSINQLEGPADEKELIPLAKAIAQSCEEKIGTPKLFLDISGLVTDDLKTGIQRVIRAILMEWLKHPPHGYRVEPIYLDQEGNYRYARSFTAKLLDWSQQPKFFNDTFVNYTSQDIYFCPDFPGMTKIQEPINHKMRLAGVKLYFMVYDIIPLRNPEYFPPYVHVEFKNWINLILKNHGAICGSKTVAEDLTAWASEHEIALDQFYLNYSHHGADIENSSPSRGMPENAKVILQQIEHKRNFLMVGTIEPRKGHDQVLCAFEMLWAQGENANLVIVGKQGWDVKKFVSKLKKHSQLNKKLFWLEGISDEFLKKIYASSTALIAASYNEGFGLPLIEAARYKLPIIARDIPIFREVAGEHAYYFHADKPSELADSIYQWLESHKNNQHVKSDGLKWLSWKESAEKLAIALNLHVQT